MADENVPSYIGRCPKCNGIVMACVDEPQYTEDTAEYLCEAVKDGLIIERVTVGYVRENWNGCQCEKQNEEVSQISMSL